MQRLQLCIHAIACVTQTVIRQRQDFVCREKARRKLWAAVISPTAIFIDIVTHVEHQIDVITRSSMAVCVEFAEAQIGAREDRNVELCGLANGQSLGPANRRYAAIGCNETEPMPLAGREIVDGNLNRMVPPGPCHHLSAACNFYKIAAFGNFHAHFGWPTGGVHITRPQKN